MSAVYLSKVAILKWSCCLSWTMHHQNVSQYEFNIPYRNFHISGKTVTVECYHHMVFKMKSTTYVSTINAISILFIKRMQLNYLLSIKMFECWLFVSEKHLCLLLRFLYLCLYAEVNTHKAKLQLVCLCKLPVFYTIYISQNRIKW